MENKILKLIDQQRAEILCFFKDMVKIPSITGEERECVEFILQKLKKIGLAAEVYEAEPGRPNIVAEHRGTKSGRVFLYNGHIDVLPPGDLSQWDRDPFSAEEINGWIYGRGTVDMKPGNTAMIMATDFLKRLKIDLAGDILLTFVSDEQRGGEKGARYLLDKGLVKGDFGLSGEPTNMDIEIATKGIFRAEITTIGKSAHTGRPWFGIDAIEKVVDLIIELRKLNNDLKRRKHPLLQGPAVLTVSMIKGGTAANMVADSCSIKIDRRFLPDETERSITKELEGVFLKLKEKDEKFNWKLIHTFTRPPMEISSSEFIVKVLTKAIKRVKGSKPRRAGKGGGTDAAFIYHRLGIPLAHFAPGVANIAASPEERVKAQDVIDATKIYALTIFYALKGSKPKRGSLEKTPL